MLNVKTDRGSADKLWYLREFYQKPTLLWYNLPVILKGADMKFLGYTSKHTGL